MATVSNLLNWITSAAGAREGAAEGVRDNSGDECGLRALPNEEIYFWVRPVDNSRVNPQADPKSTKACLRYMGSAGLAVALLVGVLFPVAYNVLAGYQIGELARQHETLLRERAELDLKEASLLNPARLAELAEMQQLVDPAPETSVPLGAAPDGAYAKLGR